MSVSIWLPMMCAHGLHEVVRRRVDHAQQQVNAAQGQHELPGEAGGVGLAAMGDFRYEHRQHQLAHGGQQRAAEVEHDGLLMLAEVGQEAPDQRAGGEASGFLLHGDSPVLYDQDYCSTFRQEGQDTCGGSRKYVISVVHNYFCAEAFPDEVKYAMI